jgi:hypothetical protein
MEKTRQLVINVDGIAPIPRSLIGAARDELAGLLTRFCKAEVAVDLLDRDKKVVEISF